MLKILTRMAIFAIAVPLHSQVREDFSTIDLDTSTWIGDVNEFEVSQENQLHLIAPSQSGESFLSISNELISNTTWEFSVRFDFNPSSSNQAFIYLVSDQYNLEGSLNGYFVRVGNSSDEVSLYRQDGSATTEIIDGVDDVVDLNPVNIRIKVTRDSIGNWNLYHDVSESGYVHEGIVFDPTHNQTNYFGFLCDYTSTRSSKFYFDELMISAPLSIVEVAPISNTSVFFELNSPSIYEDLINTANYSISGSQGQLHLITAATPDPKNRSVELTIDPPLITDRYELEIEVSEPICGELQISSTHFEYHQLQLSAFSIVDSTKIELIFNDDIHSTFVDSSFVLIDPIFETPLAIEQASDTVIVLEFDLTFIEGVGYELEINNLQNVGFNSSLDTTLVFNYLKPFEVVSIQVISETQVSVQFNKPVHVDSISSQSFILDGETIPQNVEQKDSAALVVTFSQPFSNGDHILFVEELYDHNGLLITSSSNTFNFTSLEVSEINQLDASILLTFNQSIDHSSIHKDQFHFVGSGNADSIGFYNDSIVSITKRHLLNNFYDLVVSEISNSIGNSKLYDTITFFNAVATTYRDIVINEIMADPNPSYGLPTVEYVELFNRASGTINLMDFTLNGRVLPESNIASNDFAIAIHQDHLEVFSDSICKIPMVSFDVLSNTGEFIVLKDQFGNLLDSLNFTKAWYDDPSKSEGGFSIEQVNPDLYCPDDYNYTASASLYGGTPGLENSVYNNQVDNHAPEIETISIVSPLKVLITFNKAVDQPITLDSISLEPLSLDGVTYTSFSSIDLSLTDSVISECELMLVIRGLSDCAGSALGVDSARLYYDYTAPQLLDLKILSKDELLLQFHEVISESHSEKEEHYVVNGVEPLQAVRLDSSINKLILNLPFNMEAGLTYTINALVIDTLGNQATAIESFIYEDDIAAVRIVTSNILSVSFKSPLKSPGTIHNYLLEGLGNPKEVLIDPNDSSIVHLIMGEDIKANKTQTLYVFDIYDQYDVQLSTPSKPIFLDTKPPVVENIKVISENEIILSFNEGLYAPHAINISNYLLNGDENPESSILLNPTNVYLLFDQPFTVEKQQELVIQHLTDLKGNMLVQKVVKFAYDNLPPRIDTLYQFNERQLLLQTSEHLDLDSLDTSTFSLETGENPAKIDILGPDSIQLIITFENVLDRQDSLVITVENWYDRNGNFLEHPILQYVDTWHPRVVEVVPISKSSIDLFFSHSMDEESLNENNILINGIPIDNIQWRDDRIVHVDFDISLHEVEMNCIEIGPVSDLYGVRKDHEEIAFEYKTFFHEYDLIDVSTVELFFSTEFDSVSQTQFQINGIHPSIANVKLQDPGAIQLLLKEPIVSNQLEELCWYRSYDKFGRRIPDGCISLYHDTQSPAVKSLQIDWGRIVLQYTEEVRRSLAAQYLIPALGFPTRINTINDSTVELFYSNLEVAKEYELVITNITDVQGNMLLSDSIFFTYNPPEIPDNDEIIITEIMVDPVPSKGLPETEYIELFNRSEKTYKLSTLTISDHHNSARLPDVNIGSHEYVALMRSESIDTCENCYLFVDLVSFSNQGDHIGLEGLDGSLIDELKYGISWYGDSEKDDGGYSLELINMDSPCKGSANWGASKALVGGTPGYSNSLFQADPDLTPPVITAFQVKGLDKIIIIFDRILDSHSVNKESFEFSTLEIDQFEVSNDNLIITFTEDFIPGNIYEGRIVAIRDCTGNPMEATPLRFGIGKEPEFNELIITEIMSDPEPSQSLPQIEYLELYNVTERIISLDQTRLLDDTDSTDIIGGLIFPGEYLLLTPTSGLNQFMVKNTTGLGSWIGLNNSGDNIMVKSGDDVIFSVAYDRSWFDDELKSEGGYSLEMRDTNSPCLERVNWGASNDPSGGTPGEVNSISEPVPDNFGPDIQSAYAKDENHIIVSFSEKLKQSSQIEVTIDPPLQIFEIELEFKHGKELILVTSEIVQNQTYHLEIKHLQDCASNSIRKNSIRVVLPSSPDSQLMLSEILFNPNPGGVDFVELYNSADKYINLNELIISNGEVQKDLVHTSMIVGPNSYIALTTDTIVLKNHYQTGRLVQVESLPSFNDKEGKVLICDSVEVLDSLEYHVNMHFSMLNSFEGVSLERISFNNISTKDNWKSASGNSGYATPGYLNSQFLEPGVTNNSIRIEPRVFVPDGHAPGVQNFTTINYDFEQNDVTANVDIYSHDGRLVRQLKRNINLSHQGFFQWDGMDNSGSPVPMGYYLISFEIFTPKGFTAQIIETVVVGMDLR